MMIDRALTTLREAIADRTDQIGDEKVCSAIQALVWRDDDTLLDTALGRTRLDDRGEPVRYDTPMDLASLTKPLVTATLMMQAVDEQRARFEDPISRHFPGWEDGAHNRSDATLLHLLNHSSGLPSWEAFYEDYPLDPTPKQASSTRQRLFARTARMPLEAKPGARHAYSDPGYILLAGILERIFERPLHDLARERIFEPLNMNATDFVARIVGQPPLEHAAATERCPHRGRVVCGTVHDENADVMGGTSGHAGVFGTARDLFRFCRHILRIDAGLVDDGIVSRESLRFCLSEKARGARGHHLGGWDTPSGSPSSSGRGFQAGNTVGHLGFTGTSIWIERDLGLIAILLTNRVYPSRDNPCIKELRVRFHEAILPADGVT